LAAWCALVPLFFSLEGKTIGQSFRLGWITGFVSFLGILYWVTQAMHRYGGIPIFISLIILCALTLYLSLYIATFAALLSMVQKRGEWSILILAPPLWVSLEYLRSILLTGFPWENLGYSQYTALPAIQIADTAGVYGVSFVVVLVNSLIFLIIRHLRKAGRVHIGAILCLVAVLGPVLAYGFMRIHQENQRISGLTPIKVGIVQGNIDQSLKWEDAYQKETLQIYRRLTQEVAKEKPELVIWPETAVPFFFPFDQPFSPMVRTVAPEAGVYLLFGSPFYQDERDHIRYLNSAYLLSPDGEIKGRYDKIHLVPFGEYVPLSRFLPFIRPLVEGVGDFASGEETTGTMVFSIPGAEFGVLICYEIIFPGLNRRFIRKGADFLVTVTNDAWFGKTSAPFQHFSMATFRAVENRVFVARAANTGISGIISSTGKIVTRTDIFSRHAVTGEVYPENSETFYTRHGDAFAYACMIWSILLIGGSCLLQRENGRPQTIADTNHETLPTNAEH
jgi:apolipoprotein N-acyltransferase